MTRRLLAVALLLLCVAPSWARQQPPYVITSLAGVDTDVPGHKAVKLFPDFPYDAPVISATGGKVAFWCGTRAEALAKAPDGGVLSNPYTAIGSGVFVMEADKPNSLILLALLKDPLLVDGVAVGQCAVGSAPSVAFDGAAGWVAFYSQVAPVESVLNGDGKGYPIDLFAYDFVAKKLRRVIESDRKSPQEGFACVGGAVAVNAGGTIVFGGSVAARENSVASGVYRVPATGGIPDARLLFGRPMPVTGNARQTVSGAFPLEIADSGDIAFTGSGLRTDGTVGSGVYVRSPDDKVRPALTVGDAAAGGGTIDRVYSRIPTLSSNGNFCVSNAILETTPDAASVRIETETDVTVITQAFAGLYLFDRKRRKIEPVAKDGTPFRTEPGVFSSVEQQASVNASGTVAFVAMISRTPEETPPGSVSEYAGIFVQGANGVTQPVVRTGYPLDGSVIVWLEISHRAIDDRGNIVFKYRLQDNRYGIGYAKRVR